MIGIIGAMDEEVAKLKADLTDTMEEQHTGLTFVTGKLSGKDVVVVRSGIGKVNAGACTAVLIDRYHVDYVINTGIAGSLDAHIDIGDIVLSEDAVQYDMDATNFGYQLGEIPRVGTMAFKASDTLIGIAEEENKKVNPEIRTFIGRVCSGDKFVSDHETKDWIISHFQAAAARWREPPSPRSHGRIRYPSSSSAPFPTRPTTPPPRTTRPSRKRPSPTA